MAFWKNLNMVKDTGVFSVSQGKARTEWIGPPPRSTQNLRADEYMLPWPASSPEKLSSANACQSGPLLSVIDGRSTYQIRRSCVSIVR